MMLRKRVPLMVAPPAMQPGGYFQTFTRVSRQQALGKSKSIKA